MTQHTTHPSCSAPTSAGQRRIARVLTNLCAGFPARHSSRVPALLLLSVNNWPSRLFSVPGVQEGGAPCTTHLRSAGPRTAQASTRGGAPRSGALFLKWLFSNVWHCPPLLCRCDVRDPGDG